MRAGLIQTNINEMQAASYLAIQFENFVAFELKGMFVKKEQHIKNLRKF